MGVKQISLVVTAFIVSTSVNAESITIWSSDNGTYKYDGSHNPDNGSIYTGQNKANAFSPGEEYRSFLYFDLSSISGYTVSSAAVTYVAGNGNIGGSAGSTETIELFDVTSDISNLLSGGGVSVFTDLGTGSSYGSTVVDTSAVVPSGPGPMPEVSVNLNTTALTDLNLLLSGVGTDFAIGAALSSISGSIDEVLWAGSELQPAASLTLQVSAVPIPAAVWLFSSGLIGLVGLARRKANA